MTTQAAKQTVLVTGASLGIGQGIYQGFWAPVISFNKLKKPFFLSELIPQSTGTL